MHDVVTVGEPMALLIAQQPGPLEDATQFTRASAGAELNVAIGLSRLGLRVGYLTRLGADAFGRHLLSVLAAEGIDHRHVGFDDQHPTGVMLKSRRDDGADPVVEYFRRGSAISFDPNLRPRLWPSTQAMVETLGELARMADWILPGLAEGRVLTGHDTPTGIASQYLGLGAKKVIVKLGAEGAYFATADGDGVVPGVPAPRVVDTVGAGDGFAVGVISGLPEGLPLPLAVDRGNRIGWRVVQFPGDSDGLPRREELPGLPPLPGN